MYIIRIDQNDQPETIQSILDRILDNMSQGKNSTND